MYILPVMWGTDKEVGAWHFMHYTPNHKSMA